MNNVGEHPQVLIRPPLAWALAVVAGLALDWLVPARFVPAGLPAIAIGAAVFVLGLALGVWAIVTMLKAGTNVPTNRPVIAMVTRGPYRFTRNPIYVGMLAGQTGLAIGFDSLWLLLTLVLFFAVLHVGVVRREEAFLARKFGDAYLEYQRQVRRWV